MKKISDRTCNNCRYSNHKDYPCLYCNEYSNWELEFDEEIDLMEEDYELTIEAINYYRNEMTDFLLGYGIEDSINNLDMLEEKYRELLRQLRG